MQIVLDVVRGLGLYLWVVGAGIGYGWLLMPYNNNNRMMLSVMGGGCVLVFAVVILLSLASYPRHS